eukprot:8810384-Pyramimonas_sp.AAC.3
MYATVPCGKKRARSRVLVRETAPCICSRRANREFTKEFMGGAARARARYLGIRRAWNLSSMEEFRYRCAAARARSGES